MKEKIANKLYSLLYNNPSKHNMKEFSRHLAAAILSLPVEGCDCTLGELPEQVRKMREALGKAIELLSSAAPQSWMNTENFAQADEWEKVVYEYLKTVALTFKSKKVE